MTASGAALLLRLLAVVACLAAYTHFSCAAPLALRDGALVGFEAAMETGPRTRRSEVDYGKNVWKSVKCARFNTPEKNFCNRKFMQEKCCGTCKCSPPAGGNLGQRARRDQWWLPQWWLPLPSQKPAAAMPLWNEHATAVNTIPSTGRSGITLVGSLQACQKECGPKTACVGFTYLSGTCSFYEKVGPLVQTPTWYNSYSPSSFGGAAEFCKKMNRARLATYSEYCAAGSVFGGKKSDGDQWAPYSGDGDNQWVQVGTSGHAECKKHTPQHGKPAWGTSTDKHHFENYVLCAGPQSKGTIAPDGAAWWRKNQAGVCSVPLGEVPGDEETYSSLTQWEIERELIPEYREERDNKGLVEHLKHAPYSPWGQLCAMFPDATSLSCMPLCPDGTPDHISSLPNGDSCTHTPGGE